MHFKGHIKPKHRKSSSAGKIIISDLACLVFLRNDSSHHLRVQRGGRVAERWRADKGGGLDTPQKWWRHLWTDPNWSIWIRYKVSNSPLPWNTTFLFSQSIWVDIGLVLVGIGLISKIIITLNFNNISWLPGVHFLLDVLPSWADRGSCAHKCVC